MQRFRELRVWQHAHALMLDVYRETRELPHHEVYGMQSQLRRAAVSVSANIAEGSKRETRTEYARFLNMAESSTAEMQALVLGCRDLGYLDATTAEKLMQSLAELARQLDALRKAVRGKGPDRGPKAAASTL